MNTLRSLIASLAVVTASSAAAFNQDFFFAHRIVTGQHGGVYGIGIGPDDKVYVPDYNHQKVVIYDADLQFQSEVVTVPPFYPHDVIVDDTGIVYVTDPSNNKVRRFTSSGAPLSDLLTGFPAHYIRIHPVNGHLYVKDSGGGYRVVQPDGTLVKNFSLDDGNLFTVLPDGRLLLASGRLYNDLGIRERDGLPNGEDVRWVGGVLYSGNYWAEGVIRLFDADLALRAVVTPYYSDGYLPNYGRRFNVNHKGDIIGTDLNTLYLLRRCEPGSMGPLTRNAAPVAEVVSIAQRPNTTLLDIDYRVTDLDDETVHTAVAAFVGNVNSLNNLILLTTLAEGTAANVGPGIPRSTVKRLTWDVGDDWDADFGDLSVHVFARDTRPHLMGLHLLSLPADGAVPAMQITRTPLHKSWFLEPLLWLAATGNPTVAFSRSGATGNLHGTDNAPEGYRGELLASGTTVTQKGWQFIASLMACREATSQEVQWAREAATPGIVNQWHPAGTPVVPNDILLKRISALYPNRVNEYSFDTGDYDSNWIWLIKNP